MRGLIIAFTTISEFVNGIMTISWFKKGVLDSGAIKVLIIARML